MPNYKPLHHCDHFNVCTLLWLKTKIHMLYYTYLLTYTLTYLLTYFLTYLLTYLLTHLCTCLLTYSPTHSLTHSLHGQSPSWEGNWFAASQEISPHFMEPKGSLTHIQVSTTCPYPELDQSVHAPLPTSWRSIIIFSSHLHLGLQSGLFPSGFPTNTLYTPLLSRIVLHAPPISFFSIWSPK